MRARKIKLSHARERERAQKEAQQRKRKEEVAGTLEYMKAELAKHGLAVTRGGSGEQMRKRVEEAYRIVCRLDEAGIARQASGIGSQNGVGVAVPKTVETHRYSKLHHIASRERLASIVRNVLIPGAETERGDGLAEFLVNTILSLASTGSTDLGADSCCSTFAVKLGVPLSEDDDPHFLVYGASSKVKVQTFPLKTLAPRLREKVGEKSKGKSDSRGTEEKGEKSDG